MKLQKGLRGALAPLIGLALLGFGSGACVESATTNDVPDVAAESVETTEEPSEAAAEDPAKDEEQPADEAVQPGDAPDALTE